MMPANKYGNEVTQDFANGHTAYQTTRQQSQRDGHNTCQNPFGKKRSVFLLQNAHGHGDREDYRCAQHTAAEHTSKEACLGIIRQLQG